MSFVNLFYEGQNKTMNLCNTWKEENESLNILRDDSLLYSCQPACIQSQYVGDHSPVQDEGIGSNKFIIIYMFTKNQVQISEEYFMFGVNELIGTIGGHSGLFIGFSFYGFVSEILGYIQKKLLQ